MTRALPLFVFLMLASEGLAHAQGRPVDWPSYGGDAQRTGWEKSDTRITKENVKDFQLVLKRKLENKSKGPRSLSPPAVIGLLISYRGFKELAFVSGSSDNLWAIDADVDRIFWQKHFDTAPSKARSSMCSAAVMPALVPPRNFAAAPTTTSTQKPAFAFISPASFGEPRPVFALASDGKLHMLNTANGDDLVPPVAFLPPGARASSLTFSNGILFTTTSGGCGGVPDAVWSIDLNFPDVKTAPRVSRFVNAMNAPVSGLALGLDGIAYVQAGPAVSLLGLSPGDLAVKQSFTFPDQHAQNPATPLVFRYKERDLVATAGSDGHIYLLDAQSLGGDDHRTALFQTPQITPGRIWGGLSTWEDADGTRYVYAPVWGPVSADLAQMNTNGAAPNGSIVAFRLEEHDGKPMLTPAWVSRDMDSPEPPVIAAGTVFALSAGAYLRNGQPKKSTHATLYAWDASTGKEVYSTGNQVTSPGSLNGVTIANARVYFTTTDNTLYAFGIYLER